MLRGRVRIPGSKSHTIRSVVLASLAEGKSEIMAPLVSADSLAAVRAYQNLGAHIDCGDIWSVRGTGGDIRPPDNIVDVANSGTTLRLAIGSAALLKEGAAVFTGDDQIRARPVGPLLNSLNDLGATCLSTRSDGRAPVVIRGALRGGRTTIDAVTSQYLTSLLINTPLASHNSVIEVTRLNEQPYVEMTLNYLDEQQIRYTHDGFRRFEIQGRQRYRPFKKHIPADFSSATFFLCAGVILEGDLILEGLDFSDTQGDKVVVDILRQMGADITVNDRELLVQGGDLNGIDIDLNDTPDALPALAVVACFARGRTRLLNVPQARLKETDRIAVMARELIRLGAIVKELPDGMEIERSTLKPAGLHGHDDHRVVMALSLAALALEGTSTIDTAEAVNVTFPDYVPLMQSVGAKITLVE